MKRNGPGDNHPTSNTRVVLQPPFGMSAEQAAQLFISDSPPEDLTVVIVDILRRVASETQAKSAACDTLAAATE